MLPYPLTLSLKCHYVSSPDHPTPPRPLAPQRVVSLALLPGGAERRMTIKTSSPLFYILDSELDSHLGAVAIFHVEVVAVSIHRKLKFVRICPIITYPLSLCGHSANKIHLTHINLKIVCLVISSTRTPRAISSRFFQSAKEWRFILIVVRTRFHSVIWYRVDVTHAECFACCKGTTSIRPSTWEVRLRWVPHFRSGKVKRAKREREWNRPHSRKTRHGGEGEVYHPRSRFHRSNGSLLRSRHRHLCFGALKRVDFWLTRPQGASSLASALYFSTWLCLLFDIPCLFPTVSTYILSGRKFRWH